MKRIFLSVFLLLSIVQAFSQSSPPDSAKKAKRFFIGLSYSYLSTDMKLLSLSTHSVWYGTDLGTYTFTNEEIDSINSYAERNSAVNSLNLEVGMSFLKPKVKNWVLKGSLMLGIAKSYTSIYNKNTGQTEYNLNSGLRKPSFGFGINFGYNFNSHWGVAIRPFFMTTFGKTTRITDNVNLVPENFTETIEDRYILYYERVTLMASYSVWHLTFSAGPGFYWLLSYHDYKIGRTNINDGSSTQDEIKSSAVTRYVPDGSLSIEWRIVRELTFYAFTGIGADIVVNTGIHFNF